MTALKEREQKLDRIAARGTGAAARVADQRLRLLRRHAYRRGETGRLLATLSAWRETPFFTGRERAAFEWTGSVTLPAKTHVPDAVVETR